MKNIILPFSFKYSKEDEKEAKKIISIYIKEIKSYLKKDNLDKEKLFNAFENIIYLENFCKNILKTNANQNYFDDIKHLKCECKKTLTFCIKKEFRSEIYCYFKQKSIK